MPRKVRSDAMRKRDQYDRKVREEELNALAGRLRRDWRNRDQQPIGGIRNEPDA